MNTAQGWSSEFSRSTCPTPAKIFIRDEDNQRPSIAVIDGKQVSMQKYFIHRTEQSDEYKVTTANSS